MSERRSGDENERRAIADRLRALPVPELVDVLRRVLPSFTGEECNGLRQKLVLAEVTIHGAEVPKVGDQAVAIEIVAWPDRDYYDGGFGPEPDLFEQGSCRRCGVEVTSTAKRAFCAICGELCRLT